MFFGAVVITLIMVSSATAVTAPQQNEKQNSGNGVVNYVEPGIHISVDQKKTLKTALRYVDDPDFRVLLQEIIKKKGPVDSSDIEQIIKDNNLDVGTIAVGGISTGEGNSIYSGGWAFCPRRPCCFCVVLPVVYLHFTACYQEHVFPHYPDYPVEITIHGTFIDYGIKGNAVGFCGLVWNNPAPDLGFTCGGAALLISYKPC